MSKARDVIDRLSEEFPKWDYFLEFDDSVMLCSIERNDEESGYSECLQVYNNGVMQILDWEPENQKYKYHAFTRESIALLQRASVIIDEVMGSQRYEATSDSERGYFAAAQEVA